MWRDLEGGRKQCSLSAFIFYCWCLTNHHKLSGLKALLFFCGKIYIYNIKFTILAVVGRAASSATQNTFTLLCSREHHPSPGPFCLVTGTLSPLNSNSSLPPPQPFDYSPYLISGIVYLLVTRVNPVNLMQFTNPASHLATRRALQDVFSLEEENGKGRCVFLISLPPLMREWKTNKQTNCLP